MAVEEIWKIRDCPEEAVLTLIRCLGISPWTARILVGRGICSVDQARMILNPSNLTYHAHFDLPDINPFLQRIEQAVRSKDKVILHGDYDADGITGTLIMKYALERIGLAPRVFLPSRFITGYGIQPEWVREQKEAGFNLIITVDCGSSAIEAVEVAREIGIDLIITDHHQVLPALTGAVAHINPHRDESGYPFRYLSGAGVAFKLARALVDLVPPSFQSEYRQSLPSDLAMIGTLADVMPLIDENRRIVLDGLDRIRNNPRPGIQSLLQLIRTQPTQVTTDTVAFQIGPRINAAGRLGCPSLAYDLLASENPEEAEELAKKLDKTNDQRKKLAEKHLQEALKKLEQQPNPTAVVLMDENWNQGLLGILAARLMEKTNLPTFIACLREGSFHGSARVPAGYDVSQIFQECSDLLIRGGGHAGAGGFSLLPENWELFRDRLTEILKHIEIVPPCLLVDGFLPYGPGILEFFNEVSCLEPFGEGFDPPVLSVCRYTEKDSHEIFSDKHLKLKLGKGDGSLEAVGFNLAEWSSDLGKRPLDMILEYGESYWNGKCHLRPQIRSIRPALKEIYDPSFPGQVIQAGSDPYQPNLTLWDARGTLPLQSEQILRVGYAPGWLDWWVEKVPGQISDWKKEIWKKHRSLPSGVWPGNLAVDFGDPPPEDWNGEILEILWPPLRREDLLWLNQIFVQRQQPMLVRLAWNPEQISKFVECIPGIPERLHLATTYQYLNTPKSMHDPLPANLPADLYSISLEILLDLGHVFFDGKHFIQASERKPRKMEESSRLKNWIKFRTDMQTWVTRFSQGTANDLAKIIFSKT